MRTWKKISGKIVYTNPWIKIHHDTVLKPDGTPGIYGYLEKKPGVFIVVYDTENGEILLIRQNRYPVRKTIWEIPAGVVDSRDHLSDAKRELKEEVGIVAEKWLKLGEFFVAAGHESTLIKAYLAMDFTRQNANSKSQDGDEAISRLMWVKISELKKMILAGRIDCGITLASLNHFFLYLDSAC